VREGLKKMDFSDCIKDWGIVTLCIAENRRRKKIKNKEIVWKTRIAAWEHVESCVSDKKSIFRDEFTLDQKIAFLKHLTARILQLCGAHLALVYKLYPLVPIQGNEMNCLKYIETNLEFFNLWKTVHGEKDTQDLLFWKNKIK
jgi:hypothetical protein